MSEFFDRQSDLITEQLWQQLREDRPYCEIDEYEDMCCEVKAIWLGMPVKHGPKGPEIFQITCKVFDGSFLNPKEHFEQFTMYASTEEDTGDIFDQLVETHGFDPDRPEPAGIGTDRFKQIGNDLEE